MSMQMATIPRRNGKSLTWLAIRRGASRCPSSYSNARHGGSKGNQCSGLSTALHDVDTRAFNVWSDGTRMAGELSLTWNREVQQRSPAIVLHAGIGVTNGGTLSRLKGANLNE